MTGRFPFSGIPCGWYVVAASSELGPGEVRERRYFGRELVLFRTQAGQVCLADAHCPHMGAHLGAGRVEGECLRCPFHGFQFDAEGVCVGTPYADRLPPRAQLETWPIREQNGLILTWFDAQGKLPEWEVPPLALHGWGPLACRKWAIPTHPQETSENSVDFGHFTSVHNFASAEMTKPVETRGPLLESGYAVNASLQSVGLPRLSVRAEFDVEVWGLGYSLVNVRVPLFGARCRLFVLPTPVDEEHIELRLACMSLHRSKALRRLFRFVVFRAFCQEVEEDIPVWSRKIYLDSPALAPGDGPIVQYRRWASQFYPA